MATGERSRSILPTRIAFAGSGAFLTFVGNEFADEGPALWYQYRPFGIPIHYAVFALMLALLWPLLRIRPSRSLVPTLKDMGIWGWIVLGWLTIITALFLGLLRGADEPFVDWRNWAVVAVAATVVASLPSSPRTASYMMTDLAVGIGILSLIHLVIWLAGGGTQLFDIRVPLFDTYDLMLAVFAALVAGEAWLRGFPQMTRIYGWLLRLTLVAGCLLLFLSFRRSLWLFISAGLFMLLAWSVKTRRVSRARAGTLGGIIASMALVAALMIGLEAIGERIASFNPQVSNDYTATNEDHFEDILDGISVIMDEPVFGLGIGSRYETNLIAENWKADSFEVHNAFVHAWLKFGVLGFVFYIGFHLRAAMAFMALARKQVVGFAGAGLALAAEQLVGLVQTWPYGSFQYSLFRGITLGILIAMWPTKSSQRGVVSLTPAARLTASTHLR